MFLRKNSRRCELFRLTLWASVRSQVVTGTIQSDVIIMIFWFAWAGPSISPTFALLGHATTFRITDVKYPYIICTAAFPDAHKQAVYAQVTGRDLQGERAASCVIDAPELPSGVHSVDARIKTSGAPGPRGNLQAGDEYLMQFIQPPTVLNSELQYEESEYSGYTIRVSLQNAHGVKKVKDRINAALKLNLDMSVIGLSAVSLSGALSFARDSAVATFRLPQILPNGRYPCVLTISEHPVRLTGLQPGKSDDGPQTRAQDLFNSSDSAEALPLMQPVEHHTFMLSVSVPTVQLAPSAVSAPDITPCSGDGEVSGCTGATAAPRPGAPQLWLSLKGQQVHGDVSVLLAMSIGNTSVTEADIVAAVSEREVRVSNDNVVMLPQPSEEEDGVALLWVQWDENTAHARRLLFELSDQELPEAGCFVRVFRAIAASVVRGLQSTWVAPTGEHMQPTPPVFSVQGQFIAYRGDNVTFHVLRRGPRSKLESRVLWRLVYLDPASKSELTSGLGDMINADIEPRKGINAMQRAGLLTWLPGDDRQLVDVAVPVAWDAVPHGARWMLAVRLTARQNGAVESNDILISRVQEPPPAVQPPQQLTEQINGIVPAVMGDTDWEAAAVHAIVYGVRNGACAPSTGRVRGSALDPPVAIGLGSSHSIRGLSLQVTAHKNSAVSAEHQFVQTMPLFEGVAGSYSAMVPYDLPHAAVVVSASTGEAVLLRGCGVNKQVKAPQRWSSSTVRDVINHLWFVERPENRSMCTAVVRSCAGLVSGQQSCSRGVRTDWITVKWLDDPSHARIRSVSVMVGGVTQQACGSIRTIQSRTLSNGISPLINATSERKAADECQPHAFVNTSLVYHRGDTIKIAVQPMQSGSIGSVSIGQRVFRPSADGELDRVSVAFRLFDSSDRLSPFVPFFIRQRTRDRTVLDVPIMLTLSDSITAVPVTLLLDVAVQPSRAPPVPLLPDPSVPVVHSSGTGNIPVSVEVVAESGYVSFLTNGVATAEAPIDVTASHLRRRLLDVSISAPADQPWLQDPLKNPQCHACPEGFFSNNVDVQCQRCEPGTCAPYQGMTACSRCPRGSYAPVYGASSCSPCVHGSYAQLPGSTACQLCPFGYTTKSDGAVVCDRAVEQTVDVGKEYALAVSFAVRLMGMSFDDVPQRTGVLGSSEDILQFLVSLDSAAAFKVSTADVQVSSMTELKPRVLRINLTTNIAIDAPKQASKEELDRAVSLAQLSKDAGIGNLTWDHTTEALGASAVTEDKIETEILEPDPEHRVSWQAIVMPIVAGVIILGSLMCLKIQRSRDHGLDNIAQAPSMLLSQVLGAIRAAMCPTMRRPAHRFSDLSTEVISDLGDNLQVDMRPRENGKRTSAMNCIDGIELSARDCSETRKRPVSDMESLS